MVNCEHYIMHHLVFDRTYISDVNCEDIMLNEDNSVRVLSAHALLYVIYTMASLR